MADEKIVFKVVVDDEGNIVKLQSTEKGFRDIDLTVKNAENSAKKLNQTIGKTGSGATLKGVKLTRIEYDKLIKTQHQAKSAVGASTSATLELGRVLSDMPYGIRGVANNLQQLASNLFFMSKATDATTGKTVGLMGAFGSLLKGLIGPAGILIAFQGIIALFDFLSQGAKDVEKSVSDLNSEFKDLATILTENVNVSIEDYLKLVKQKTDLDDKLTKSSKRLKEIEEELQGIQYSKERTNNFELLQKLRNQEITLQNEIETIYKTSADSINKYKKAKDDLTKADEDSLKGLKNTLSELKKERELRAKSPEDYKRLSIEIQEFQDKIDKIEAKNKGKRERVTTLVTPDSIKKQVKLGKSLIKAVAKVMGVELGKNPIDLNKLIDVELSDETKALIKKYNEDLKAEMALSDQLGDAQDFISKSQDILGGMTDFMNAQFEREMTIESNKTNALNEQLNQRLLNENLSKDERAKIQNQIALNDEKLRVKQEKIAKKQFDMNKASNIANALMDTSAAAIGVMKDAKGGFFARLSQALPTIAFGLAQVATISRQKFQTSAAKTPIRTTADGGTGGATSERAEPSFNIVGRSNDNLLINAIQAQFGKPLKAYVVSRDVTTQQQLDGMIVGQAGT